MSDFHCESTIVAFGTILSRNRPSKVLSQTNAVARASLELQLINSNKIVELSETVASLHSLSHEASQTSVRLLNMVDLLHETQASKPHIQEIQSGVDFLTLKAQGWCIKTHCRVGKTYTKDVRKGGRRNA